MDTNHLVRATDPLSSVLAAERTPEFAGSHCDRILSAMAVVAKGQLGATAAEIGQACGLSVVQVDRRMHELQTAGRVALLTYEDGNLMRGGYRCWTLARGPQ